MRPLKTLQEIEFEEQAKQAELTGIEAKLLEWHDREHEVRNALQHLEIQRYRIIHAGV